MGKLTKKEKQWVAELNKILAACPSDRIGFATIGDHEVTLFDVTRMDDIYACLEDSHSDFIPSASKVGAVFDGVLTFPNAVESTAG